jgi:hypothetical protein
MNKLFYDTHMWKHISMSHVRTYRENNLDMHSGQSNDFLKKSKLIKIINLLDNFTNIRLAKDRPILRQNNELLYWAPARHAFCLKW